LLIDSDISRQNEHRIWIKTSNQLFARKKRLLSFSRSTQFTEEQIIPALEEVEVNLPVKELDALEVCEARRTCTFKHLSPPTP